MKRQNIATGTIWEDIAGYSRAVRKGNMIVVAGTTATDDAGQVVGAGDPEVQTRFILQKIERAIKSAGGTLEDVIRTRIFVVDRDQWEVICRVHSEFFDKIRPVTTLVEVSGLIGDAFLVEIEADALVDDTGA